MRATSTRFLAPVVRMIDVMWVVTVPGDRKSRSAISELDSPSPINEHLSLAVGEALGVVVTATVGLLANAGLRRTFPPRPR